MVSRKHKIESKKPELRQKRSTLWIQRCDPAIRMVFYLSLVGGATIFLPKLFYDGFEVPKLFLVQLGAATIVFLLLFRSALKGALEITLPSAVVPLVVLFLLSAASIGWGINPLLGLEELYRVSTLAGFCFFAFYLYRNREITFPLYFILFASLALAVWALMLEYHQPLRDLIYPSRPIIPGMISAFYNPLMGNQGNPNFMMHILALSVPMALGAFVQELVSPRHPARRRTILFMLAMAAAVPSFCILSSQNRSGLLALFAGVAFAFIIILKKGRSSGRSLSQVLKGRAGRRILAFIIILEKRRSSGRSLIQRLKGRAGRRILVLIVLVVLSTVLFLTSTTLGRTLGGKISGFAPERLKTWSYRFGTLTNLDDITVYSRVVFFWAGVRMIREDPLLGQGIGQFVLNFPGYKSEKDWSVFPMRHPPILRWAGMTKQSHNEFFQVCLATGLPGLALFFCFWIILFILVLRYFNREKENQFRYLVLGASAGVFGTLVNALFSFPLQTVTSATFFWATVGVLLAECSTSRPGPGWLDRKKTWMRLSLSSNLAKCLLVFGALGFLVLCVSGSARLIKARYLFFDSVKKHAPDLDYRIRQCKASVRTIPYHFETQYVLAFLYTIANDSTGARQHFERTIELAPYFPEPYKYLPGFYFNNNDPARAEATLRRFYDFHPRNIPNIDYPYLDFLLGFSILRNTPGLRLEEAEKWLKKSHTRDADMALGIAYYERGRYDESEALLEPWSRETRARGQKIDINIRLTALKYLGLISGVKKQWETARGIFIKVDSIARENSPEFSHFAEESRAYLDSIERQLAAPNAR